MEKLSDFKPLKRVTLPGIGDLNCSGLTLFVGPNSSGKSQCLKDIFHRLCGDARKLVVAKNIDIDKPEYEPFVKCLEAEGVFETIVSENGTAQLRPRTTYFGTGQAIPQIDKSAGQKLHRQYDPINQNSQLANEYLKHFGKMLVTALFLDRRLVSLNQVNVIDFETQPPQQDLHSLYLDDDARNGLFDEMMDSFGKAVWPDSSRGNTMCIRVSDEGVLPTAEDRLSFKKMSSYRTIEDEGDGLKSYVATCVSLLLGKRPICIIDEPEMCLHPPQAHNLGRFIGRYGTSTETATFVATHSSEILRGAIQASKNIQIVRLTRERGNFVAHLVPSRVLEEALKKPTVRAESVLDGIFAQSVLIVEADGDRVVYQTVLETLVSEIRLDAHFTAVGGVGGISDTCKLYRTLNIPIGVIADLDLINDPVRLKRILDEMTTEENSLYLSEKAKQIIDDVRKLPPNISTEDFAKEMGELRDIPIDWDSGKDIDISKKLIQLSRKLDRMRKLKRGGIFAMDDPIQSELKLLADELMKVGVFLVPVGELEGWLENEKINVSKKNKWAWANAASNIVQEKGASAGDVWDFMRNIGRYLSKDMYKSE